MSLCLIIKNLYLYICIKGHMSVHVLDALVQADHLGGNDAFRFIFEVVQRNLKSMY